MKAIKHIRYYLAIKGWEFLLSESELDRLTMIRFRALSASFGYPVSDMTDEELRQAAIDAHKQMSRCGVSVDEAVNALKRINLPNRIR